MALVAARSIVVKIEPGLWPVLYRNLVIAMQMTLTAGPSNPQFLENDFARRLSKTVKPEVAYSVWFPAAINAAPPVSKKGKNAKPVVIGVVTAP